MAIPIAFVPTGVAIDGVIPPGVIAPGVMLGVAAPEGVALGVALPGVMPPIGVAPGVSSHLDLRLDDGVSDSAMTFSLPPLSVLGVSAHPSP